MIKQFYILFKVFQSYQSKRRTDVNNSLLIRFGNNLVCSGTQPCNPVIRVGNGNFSAKQMHLAPADVMCTESWGIISTSVNFLNIRTPQKNCCNHSKIWTMWLFHRVMSPNDADGMANSVDPDQTAPLGAVWSGSALFAQTCLSENLGKLWYLTRIMRKHIFGVVRIGKTPTGQLSYTAAGQRRINHPPIDRPYKWYENTSHSHLGPSMTRTCH